MHRAVYCICSGDDIMREHWQFLPLQVFPLQCPGQLGLVCISTYAYLATGGQ